MILIIALALFAFILSDIIKKGRNSGNVHNTVATIDGVDLTREDFMNKVDDYQRKLGPNASASQAMNYIWDLELKKVLYNQRAEALGLAVGEDQLNDQLALSLGNNPTFQDENGVYSQAKLVEYVAAIQGNPSAKADWDNFIQQVKDNLVQAKYNTLVRSGLIATQADGEEQYRFENDKINVEYVQVPYTKIADEDVEVSEADIEKYMKAHPNQFEVDPLVDIEYVSFQEEPSVSDIQEAENAVASLKEEFGTTEDFALFVDTHSDKNYVDKWYSNGELPKTLQDTLLKLPEGTVYGPYKEEGTFNLTKVVASKQLPDSVEARHILIPVGLSKVDSISRNPEQAKALADSLLTVLKANRSKFGDFVKKYSSDMGSSEKGGHYDWFAYNTMVAPFRDFCFESKVGDMGVVETQFGYHIIEVEGQKDKQQAVKIATITKEIEPSEKTLTEVFSESAKFEEAARVDFAKAAEDRGLTPKPVNRIGRMDANIPGIGNNRTIVNWAFSDEANVGDIKRFDVNDSYVIARLTRKSTKKALMSVSEASATVTPILRKEKKAKMIREGISGTTLQEVATSQNVTVKTANALTRMSPTIAGAGTEPLVVGIAFGTATGESTGLIDGDSGVFKVRVLSIEKAPDMENYAPYVNQLKSAVNANTVNKNIYDALKAAADIEDNRADFF